MKDRKNRDIDYIRISITDRCNLRCIYCMPEAGVPSIPHKEILSFEEIERLCRCFVKLGIHKVKLTGGEPLVRKGCDMLADMLHRIDGISSITITTNGVLLKEHIQGLVNAGVTGVNISLDALNPDRYENITRRSLWSETLAGIDAALKYPSLKLKINCVPIAGVNEQELVKIAELARDHEIHVRFIEMMPIGLGKDYSYMKEDAVIGLLEKSLGKLSPCKESLGNGPARYYSVPGFCGKIGFISARTHKFCDSCNRVRLTSDGFLKTCLQYNAGCDLKSLLRSGSSDDELERAIVEALYEKPDCHQFESIASEECLESRTMSNIGG